MTQLDAAKAGEITPEMVQAAKYDGVSPDEIRQKLAAGSVVIPKNRLQAFEVRAIGLGLSTKINANIGTSASHASLPEEIEKLRVAIEAGADAVMDLSTGGDIDLGPLPTDIAPGYDHIVGAIGGAIAAGAGADFLCYVTPAEHLGLPTIQDVHEGVIASRIAAHIGDLEKGVAGAWKRNENMSKARRRFDWEAMFQLALDPVKARRVRCMTEDKDRDVCTMCGELCAIKTYDRFLKGNPVG
jgi:thiamine biosynthesis protein ThiC